MRLDAETCAQAQNRPGILRDVRLMKGDPHGAHKPGRLPKRHARPMSYATFGHRRDSGLALFRQGCQ
jgi:hypothetical protein